MQQKLIDKTFSYQDMKEIDKTDNTLTRGMIKAEKIIKADLYTSPWYIELSNRIKHATYWRLAISQLLTKVSHMLRMQQIAK